MLIVCPSCASEYDIDPPRLGSGGRKVRCATCRADWFAAPPPIAIAAGSAPETNGILVQATPLPNPPRVRPPPPGAGHARGPRSKVPRGAKPPRAARRWAAVAVVATLLAVPAAIAARRPLVAAVPQSASLFAAIGLDVNLVGLRLAGVSSSLQEDAGARVLVVEGDIASVRSVATAVPEIEIIIEGEAGETLYQWATKAPVAELDPGGTAHFRARLASPPPDGRRVLVTFAEPRGRADIALR